MLIVKENEKTVTLQCTIQNHRFVNEIEGDTLQLSTEKPIKSGGKETMSYLSWKRAEPI